MSACDVLNHCTDHDAIHGDNPMNGEWELLNGEMRSTALAFSANGKFLAVGSADGRVALWDCSTAHVLVAMLDPRFPEGLKPGIDPARAPHPWNRIGYRAAGTGTDDGAITPSTESVAQASFAMTDSASIPASTAASVLAVNDELNRSLSEHQRALLLCRGVTSLSWSKDSQRLLVGYAEQVPPLHGTAPWYERWDAGRLCLWRVDTQTLEQTLRLPVPVRLVELHPNFNDTPIALVCTAGSMPQLVCFKATAAVEMFGRAVILDASAAGLKDLPTEQGTVAAATPKADAAAIFSTDARHVFYVNSRGAFRVASLDGTGPGGCKVSLVHHENVPGGAPVPLLRLHPSGKSLLCGSRAGLRHISSTPPFAPLRIFTVKLDVNAVVWAGASFSHDAVRLLGIPCTERSKGVGAGSMCVWDNVHAQAEGDGSGMKLVKPLDGDVLVAVWNPRRAAIAACDQKGSTFVLRHTRESSFPGAHYPPRFRVVSDNVEYVEPEDEFDVGSDGRSKRRNSALCAWGQEDGFGDELKRRRISAKPPQINEENNLPQHGVSKASSRLAETAVDDADVDITAVEGKPDSDDSNDATCELFTIPCVPCSFSVVEDQAAEADVSATVKSAWHCGDLLPPFPSNCGDGDGVALTGEPVKKKAEIRVVRRCATPEPPKQDKRKASKKKGIKAKKTTTSTTAATSAAVAADVLPQVEPDGPQVPKMHASWQKMCTNVLNAVMEQDSSQFFLDPVDPVALQIPDYFTIIKEPMDLGSVEKKLKRGRYKSIDEFAADVRLTFKNAQQYNGRAHPVSIAAAQLRDCFEEALKMQRLLVAK